MPSRSRRRRRHPKTISTQGLTGQRGVNLIERVVLEMGCRWTPSGPNEVGIDGYIELFDANSRRPLGLTVGVQSKAVTAAADNSKLTLDYWCDPNDIEYWLNGNTPVILVVSSPASNEAYWVSIKGYFKDWTPTSSPRVTFVKEQHRFSAASFRELVEIAAPKAGLYLAPTRCRETLYSNLLPLEAYPPRIFIAGTDCPTSRDVWSQLHKRWQGADAGWVLWEKRIFSFHDLGEEPWTSICDAGTLEDFPTTEWSESDDLQRRRVFVNLLNQSLKAQIGPEVRYWPRENCYAIAGPPRRLSYQSLKRPSKISVVSRFTSIAADGRQFEWWRHMAFRGQFRFLEDQWYLEVTPTYRFTTDGFALDRFHEDRLRGIKALEGNRAVLSPVLFWADYLRPKASLFDSRTLALQFGRPLAFGCDVGIVDRAWLSDDPDFARDTELQRLLFSEEDDL